MKKLLILTVVFLGLASAAYGDLSNGYLEKIIEETQASYPKESGFVSSRATLSCPGLTSGSYPTSVHRLRPHNIEVIGAIGDSLTAANGAKASSKPYLINEDRGVAWSIGCEKDLSETVTLATIMKTFAPNLYGCSNGTGKHNSVVANLNLAQPGHTSFDMPAQANMLVFRIQNTVSNYDKKWKVITLFIGGNDLCEACSNPRQTVANFVKNIQEALDIFKRDLPRTFVNVVLTLDVTGIDILDGFGCRILQQQFCDCAFSHLTQTKTLAKDYAKAVEDLILSGRYDTDELFTAVVQPFMVEMTPPTGLFGRPDYSYFAPDCFHFSQKGHETAAIELWNAMLTPYPLKKRKWTLNQPIKCPTSSAPFFYTHVTSRATN